MPETGIARKAGKADFAISHFVIVYCWVSLTDQLMRSRRIDGCIRWEAGFIGWALPTDGSYGMGAIPMEAWAIHATIILALPCGPRLAV